MVKERTGRLTCGNTVVRRGPVVFDFRLGREREGPKRFLGNFEGILQSDGYGAYERVGGPGIVQGARVQALPGSALAKGCNYTLTLWSRLTRFLDYPQLELSNNLAENAIRPVALGRNYEQFGIRISSNEVLNDFR
jgi:hypothetical protein